VDCQTEHLKTALLEKILHNTRCTHRENVQVWDKASVQASSHFHM